MELSKFERVTLLSKLFQSYFESKGFKEFKIDSTLLFVCNVEGIFVSFFLRMLKDGKIGIGPLALTIYEIEDYILEVGIPSNNLIEQKKKEKEHLPTVILRTIPDEIISKSPQTTLEIEEFASSFFSFYENEALTFINKYKVISNILLQMDKLREEGKYWNEILSGGPEHLVKGLIISKLCNDPNYFNKYNWVDPLLSDIEDWLPYWEKYKVVLEGIKPVFNLEN